MKYLDRFLARVAGPEKSGDPRPRQPPKPPKPDICVSEGGFGGFGGTPSRGQANLRIEAGAAADRLSDDLLSTDSSPVPGVYLDVHPPGWRLAVARLPQDRWSIWRARSGEIQAGLGVERTTVEQIEAADHQAFRELLAELDTWPAGAVEAAWPGMPKPRP